MSPDSERELTLVERLRVGGYVAPRLREATERKHVFVVDRDGRVVGAISHAELGVALSERAGIELDVKTGLRPEVILCPVCKLKMPIKKSGRVPMVCAPCRRQLRCTECGALKSVKNGVSLKKLLEYRCARCGPLGRPKSVECRWCGKLQPVMRGRVRTQCDPRRGCVVSCPTDGCDGRARMFHGVKRLCRKCGHRKAILAPRKRGGPSCGRKKNTNCFRCGGVLTSTELNKPRHAGKCYACSRAIVREHYAKRGRRDRGSKRLAESLSG